MSPSELQALRDRKARRIARYCYDYVPFYRKMFRRLGLTPEDFRDADDLGRLPVTSRGDIFAFYPELLAARGAKVGMSQSTSGTTGRPIRIGMGARLCDIRVAQSMRRAARLGIMPWEKVATIETSGSAVSSGGRRTRPERDRLVAASKIIAGSFHVAVPTFRQLTLGLGRDNSADVCSALVQFKPDVLYSRPSHARRLGLSLRKRGTHISPRLVMCNGEFMSKATRLDLESYYRADVYNSYGARELGSVATDCYLHEGMHLNADNFIHEVVKDGAAVSQGESGNVILTGFENEATPLLRYEIGDVGVQGARETCGCGSSFPRIESILGRSGDGLVASDGTMVPPGTICDELESVLGLRDFQVIQEGVGAIVVKVRDADNNDQTREKVIKALRGCRVSSQEVRMETWGDADMPAKYRPVMSYVARP
jgi:phenylacetate-CoA ligase